MINTTHVDIKRFLGQPVNSASLGFFRIAFGLLAFFDVLNHYVYYHLTVNAYNVDRFQFAYYGFEWVKVFPEPWMTVFFFILMLAAAGITLGWQYRLNAVVFAVGFTYLFLLEKSFYLNHGYLFCWISWLLVFFPADVRYALRVKMDKKYGQRYIPYWPLFLLQFLMGLVYFYAGIAKLNADWLNAIPLKYWLPAKSDLYLIGPLFKSAFMAYLMSYGGIFIDLFTPFLLLFRRTRPWIFGLAVLFHITNALIFNIGIFPYLSISLTALFFSSDFPERILKKLGISPSHHPSISPSFSISSLTIGLIILLITFHVSYPLRRYWFQNNTAWTEEGHRYSWRMMLRSKQGYGTFTVVDLDTGEKERIQPYDHLHEKQARKLFTHPDMILQFAHRLRDQYEASGKKVAVYADIKVSLNGKKYETYVDPTIDLCTVEWSFFRSKDWIR